jgi:hypothetical protein
MVCRFALLMALKYLLRTLALILYRPLQKKQNCYLLLVQEA